MSNRFVGQLVRVNYPGSSMHSKECRVISGLVKALMASGPDVGSIKWVHQVDLIGATGRICGYEPHCLEPILPSGQVAITLEQLIETNELKGFGLERILEFVG